MVKTSTSAQPSKPNKSKLSLSAQEKATAQKKATAKPAAVKKTAVAKTATRKPVVKAPRATPGATAKKASAAKGGATKAVLTKKHSSKPTAAKKSTTQRKTQPAQSSVGASPTVSNYSRYRVISSAETAAGPRDLTIPVSLSAQTTAKTAPRFRAADDNYRKKRKRKSFLVILLRILAILLIVGCAVGIASIFWPEFANDLERNRVEQEYSSSDGKIDIAALQAKYPEVVAWVKLPDTNISYPVVYSGDNDKYLYTNLEGNYDQYGSIFLDKSNRADLSDANNVIYGHNMFNRTMFSEINRFREHAFLGSYGTGTVYTAQATLTIKPIALIKIHMSEGKYLVRNFARQVTADTFMQGMIEKTITNLDGYEYVASPESRYWSLITCSSPDNENRLVLLTEVINSEPV